MSASFKQCNHPRLQLCWAISFTWSTIDIPHLYMNLDWTKMHLQVLSWDSIKKNIYPPNCLGVIPAHISSMVCTVNIYAHSLENYSVTVFLCSWGVCVPWNFHCVFLDLWTKPGSKNRLLLWPNWHLFWGNPSYGSTHSYKNIFCFEV